MLLTFFITLSIRATEVDLASRNCATVTMASNGGRFGDKISNYLQAQWIAHVTGFAFLYKPFRYSDQLRLHYHDAIFTEAAARSFKVHEAIKNSNHPRGRPRRTPTMQTLRALAKRHHKDSTLYTPEFSWFGYDFDYQSDRSFIEKMRPLVAPHEALPLIAPPDNHISIALHLRTGVGYDDKVKISKREVYRTRFPPHDFYARAINDILRLVSARPLYIHVFTDHPSPEKPICEIQRLLSSMQRNNIEQEDARNILWRWRTEGNRHDKNVLIDFFSLCNFDCLIRPWSGFSGCAEILGDHALIIDIFREVLDKPASYRIRPNVQSGRYAKLQMSKQCSKVSVTALHQKKKWQRNNSGKNRRLNKISTPK